MRLSICIPTYNRADYLPELLDSIAAQTGHRCEVEVVISDNASTDATPEVIERYRGRIASLRYHRASENRGPDRNFLKVVELATGDWCWLMGSDDVIELGGIATVERALAAHPDAAAAYVQRNAYTTDLASKVPQLISSDLDRTDLIQGADQIFSRLGQFIGFLSSNIVNRRVWNDVVANYPLKPFFNAWVHVYVMGRMMQQRPAWVCVAQPCVGYRTGNDSFLEEGLYRRLEIDVVGYEQVTGALFGRNSPVYRRVMLQILTHAQLRIVAAKIRGAPASFFRRARLLMVKTYGRYPRFWVQGYPLLLMPSGAYRVARGIYNRLLRPKLFAEANG